MTKGKIRKALIQIANVLKAAGGSTRPLTGPLRVQWDITFNCNSRCISCHRWREKHTPEEELSTEEAKSLLRQFADCDVLNVSFAGNEPLLRRDIFELTSYAKEVGLTTSMNTNGLLVDEKVARLICQSGLDMIYFSLDGPNPETNDAIRGIKGAFQRTLEAAQLVKKARLKDSGPKVMVNTVANHLNVARLVETADMCRSLQFDGMLIQPLHYIEKQFEAEDPLHFLPGDIDVLSRQLEVIKKDLMDFIPLMPEYFDHFRTFYENPDFLYRYRCLAAYGAIDIRPNGDFAPCPAWDLRLGNFHNISSFKEFWHSGPVQAVRRQVKDKQHPICWFACIVPMNILVSYLHPSRWHKLLRPALLLHVARKTGG
ncbi:MAG: radical SAM protein [Chloroflexota bacterium]